MTYETTSVVFWYSNASDQSAWVFKPVPLTAGVIFTTATLIGRVLELVPWII
jgi:hypothetical protein